MIDAIVALTRNKNIEYLDPFHETGTRPLSNVWIISARFFLAVSQWAL